MLRRTEEAPDAALVAVMDQAARAGAAAELAEHAGEVVLWGRKLEILAGMVRSGQISGDGEVAAAFIEGALATVLWEARQAARAAAAGGWWAG